MKTAAEFVEDVKKLNGKILSNRQVTKYVTRKGKCVLRDIVFQLPVPTFEQVPSTDRAEGKYERELFKPLKEKFKFKTENINDVEWCREEEGGYIHVFVSIAFLEE